MADQPFPTGIPGYMMEASGKPTVLLIEDTMSLARLYEQYLSTVDVKIRTVETGRAGLDVINNDPPDLVLLDISLPDINGLDILRHINEKGNIVAIKKKKKKKRDICKISGNVPPKSWTLVTLPTRIIHV